MKSSAAHLPALLLTIASFPAYGQPRPAFEVASIKPNKTGAGPDSIAIAPGGQRFTATNTSLKLLVIIAYDAVNDRRVSGGPGWVNSEHYDIDAKADRSASPQEIHRMLQNLLEDRFKLKLHHETKETPVYVLTAVDYQPHFRENPSGGPPHPFRRGSDGQTIFENSPISQLAYFLDRRLDREVIDQTGLKGNYDFELNWTPNLPSRGGDLPEGPAPDPNASVVRALREQLGLKLTATKAPMEMLVIDGVEKPSAN
jgi:uncharacterized protein (TIGR03435 family)